jgi:hypothetical protein
MFSLNREHTYCDRIFQDGKTVINNIQTKFVQRCNGSTRLVKLYNKWSVGVPFSLNLTVLATGRRLGVSCYNRVISRPISTI